MGDKQALFDELVPFLDRPRRATDGRLMSYCPCHPDGAKHAGQERGMAGRSLSLHPRIGLTCFAGCKFENIVQALRNGHDRLPAPPPQGRDRLVAIYDYLRPDGTLAAQKRRYEGPDGKRFTWPEGTRMADMPLYGAEAVTQAPRERIVWFVEGEKAMECCTEHGLLAVTVPGSASQTEFGDSLKILEGHPVRLWPDNDAPGRALMTLLFAKLKGLAANVSFVTPPIPLPVKGDAYDYFAAGGTVEALEKAQPPTAPVVEVLGMNHIRVTIPTAGGLAIFSFEELEASTHRLEAQVEVSYGDGEPYRERRNLISGTQRTELRRSLDEFYGKEPGWERLLNTAYHKTRTTFGQLDPSIALTEIPLRAESEQFFIGPLLPQDAVTILFGDGSAGKTYVAEELALCCATGLPFAGMATPGLPVLFVDYEDTAKTFRWRLHRLALGLGLDVPPSVRYWPGGGIPFAQQAASIRRRVAEMGVGLVIIDSAAIACGDEPEKSVVAAAFFRALATLKVTCLVLAHVTKATDPTKPFAKDISTLKPFGSVFWHNSARRTWWVNREHEEDTPVVEVALTCRKVNDGRWPKAIPLHLTFTDPAGPIRIERGDFEVSSELAKGSLTLNSRIKLALGRGALDVKELLAALGMKDTKANYDTVYVYLHRGSQATARRHKIYDHVGSKWGLAANEY